MLHSFKWKRCGGNSFAEAWISNIQFYQWDQSHVTIVWNTWETGERYNPVFTWIQILLSRFTNISYFHYKGTFPCKERITSLNLSGNYQAEPSTRPPAELPTIYVWRHTNISQNRPTRFIILSLPFPLAPPYECMTPFMLDPKFILGWPVVSHFLQNLKMLWTGAVNWSAFLSNTPRKSLYTVKSSKKWTTASFFLHF